MTTPQPAPSSFLAAWTRLRRLFAPARPQGRTLFLGGRRVGVEHDDGSITLDPGIEVTFLASGDERAPQTDRDQRETEEIERDA